MPTVRRRLRCSKYPSACCSSTIRRLACGCCQAGAAMIRLPVAFAPSSSLGAAARSVPASSALLCVLCGVAIAPPASLWCVEESEMAAANGACGSPVGAAPSATASAGDNKGNACGGVPAAIKGPASGGWMFGAAEKAASGAEASFSEASQSSGSCCILRCVNKGQNTISHI